MLQHQFPDKTAPDGFAPLPPSGLLITATIHDEVPSSSPAFIKRNSRGTDPFQSAGSGFNGFRTSIPRI
jgi:hypothetical protein